MKCFIIAIFSILSFSALAQNRNGNGMPVAGTRPPDEAPVEGKPLEHRENNDRDQRPAFAGQTRAGAVITKTHHKEEVITSMLHHPWGIAFMPDGRMLITEKRGTLRIVSQSGLVSDTLKGLPKDIVYGGDAGLLDITVDPEFRTNRNIYFAYVQRKSAGTGLVVAAAELSNDEFRLQNFKIIYRVNDSTGGGLAHYGSRLLFDKEGRLLVSTSERMYEYTREKAQWLSSALGKILRINKDGTPAAGNPQFTDSAAALPEIWALGLRNPQGMAFNPVTGDLWEDEHGTQGGDEVNIVKPGKNYGWPVIAYGIEYDGRHIGAGITQKPGMEQPVYYWDPTIAPSGCAFYTGVSIPEWKNNMFIAALAGQHLVRLVIKNNKVVGEERLLLAQHQRIRDVEMGPDGNLWVITDADNGRLIRISKK